MAFCDKLEEYLKKEGFCPEKTDFGLQFKYETLDFIHFRDDQDENFLNLFFPQIFEVTEENRADVYAALNKANADVKVAKGAVRFENAVWAGVEMLLSDNFELGDVVPRSLNMMIYYRDAFYQLMLQRPPERLRSPASKRNSNKRNRKMQRTSSSRNNRVVISSLGR